jgi:hypothetical protein
MPMTASTPTRSTSPRTDTPRTTSPRTDAPRTRLWTALHAVRHALTAHQALERDLAGYTSQSDLDDLYAMLDRYSDRETAQIRHILAARRG